MLKFEPLKKTFYQTQNDLHMTFHWTLKQINAQCTMSCINTLVAEMSTVCNGQLVALVM